MLSCLMRVCNGDAGAAGKLDRHSRHESSMQAWPLASLFQHNLEMVRELQYLHLEYIYEH